MDGDFQVKKFEFLSVHGAKRKELVNVCAEEGYGIEIYEVSEEQTVRELLEKNGGAHFLNDKTNFFA